MPIPNLPFVSHSAQSTSKYLIQIVLAEHLDLVCVLICPQLTVTGYYTHNDHHSYQALKNPVAYRFSLMISIVLNLWANGTEEYWFKSSVQANASFEPTEPTVPFKHLLVEVTHLAKKQA